MRFQKFILQIQEAEAFTSNSLVTQLLGVKEIGGHTKFVNEDF